MRLNVDADANANVNVTIDEPYIPSEDLVEALADLTDAVPPPNAASPTVADSTPGTSHEPALETSVQVVASAEKPLQSSNAAKEDAVDWSRFAYTQYVTNHEYLCNSVMLLESLHRLESKADRVIMYPREMLPDPQVRPEDQPKDDEGRLLVKARDQYGVKLIPIDLQHKDLEDRKSHPLPLSSALQTCVYTCTRLSFPLTFVPPPSPSATWADSYTKLLAFNQTQYDRVLSIDSDGMILQHMDELFLLPPAPLAAPRAYWLLDNDPPQKILSSQLLLVQPSTREFDRIAARIDGAADNEFDMEIVNQLYLDAALVLPHRPYDMLTAEFRRANHAPYLGSDAEPWDPVAVYNEAKYIHFSDWPVPKPWYSMDDDVRDEAQPPCVVRDEDGTEDCLERELWSSLYEEFAQHRLVSGFLSRLQGVIALFANVRTGCVRHRTRQGNRRLQGLEATLEFNCKGKHALTLRRTRGFLVITKRAGVYRAKSHGLESISTFFFL